MVEGLQELRVPVNRKSQRNGSERKEGIAHVGGLVVLDEAAKGALGGAECTIEHVRVHLFRVALLFHATSDFERSGF